MEKALERVSSMHLTISILTIIISLKWGKWEDWRKYHTGMLFIATGGLLYEFIVQDNELWKFHPDFLFGQRMTVIVYALITMPVSILLFLSHYPERFFQRLKYILLWTVMYIAVEWILDEFGRITYHNGWNLGYSFLFDIVMFFVIGLHHHFPGRAYILSLGIISFLIVYFEVPFHFLK